MRTIE
jgi:mRNA interferase YafQ